MKLNKTIIYPFIIQREMHKIRTLFGIISSTKLVSPTKLLNAKTRFGAYAPVLLSSISPDITYFNIIIPKAIQFSHDNNISFFKPPLLISSESFSNKPSLLGSNKIFYDIIENKYQQSGLLQAKPGFIKDILASQEAYIFLMARIITPSIWNFLNYKHNSTMQNKDNSAIQERWSTLKALEYTISQLFADVPCDLLNTFMNVSNIIIIKYFSGNKINAHKQNALVNLFGITCYPREMLKEAFIDKCALLNINYVSFPQYVPIITFIEKFFLVLNLHDLPSLLPSNTKFTIYAINNEDVSRIRLFSCDISYAQTEQNFPDFALIVNLTDMNNNSIQFIIFKDIKAASTDSRASGRLSIIPGLNTDYKMAKQYTNGIKAFLGQLMHEKNLDKNSSMGVLYNDIAEIQKNMKPYTIEKSLNTFFTRLKKDYTNPEILKYMNVSLCVDPGIETDFFINHLPRLIFNIKKNANAVSAKKILDAFYGPGNILNKNKITETVKEIIKTFETNEEIKEKMLENFNIYIKNTPENDQP